VRARTRGAAIIGDVFARQLESRSIDQGCRGSVISSRVPSRQQSSSSSFFPAKGRARARKRELRSASKNPRRCDYLWILIKAPRLISPAPVVVRVVEDTFTARDGGRLNPQTRDRRDKKMMAHKSLDRRHRATNSRLITITIEGTWSSAGPLVFWNWAELDGACAKIETRSDREERTGYGN